MTVLDLINELQKSLSEHLKNLKLPAQSETPKTPKVFALKLPTTNVLDGNLYPLAVLEFAGSSDDAQQSLTQLLITCGVYATAESQNGAEDLIILTEAVKQYLLTHKLIKSFSLQYPLEVVPVESDNENFFFAQILATYKGFTTANNYINY